MLIVFIAINTMGKHSETRPVLYSESCGSLEAASEAPTSSVAH